MTPKRLEELRASRDETTDPIARRQFMLLMGAALGLAGVEGCTRAPSQEIVPYVVQPPETRPGRPRFYASSTVLDGYATGVLVETHEGRPTKIEGNPDHPASLGATSVFDQASVLDLYAPSRLRAPKHGNRTVAWDDALATLRRGSWTERRGEGLHVLLAPTSSPSLVAMIGQLRARWPATHVHFHAAASKKNAWEGARLAFGRVVEPRWNLESAEVVVSLGADFLASGPQHLRLARQFGKRRREPGATRLYVVESLLTVTGAAADERLRVRPSQIANALSPESRFGNAVLADLEAHRGRSVVIAGDDQPPAVHALAHQLNDRFGNVGITVDYAPSPIFEAGEPSHDLGDLEGALRAGAVDTLLVLGCENPTFTSTLGPHLARARQSAYLGHHEDETGRACTFVLPLSHALESWGDARAFDGTVTIQQPTIAPLHATRTVLEVLAECTGLPFPDDRRLVQGTMSDQDFRRALRLGVVASTASPIALVRARLPLAVLSPSHELEVVVSLDPRMHDGRFATNAWLLELPTPITKLTWGNAATISPETAAPLGIVNGDELEIAANGNAVRAPALIVPGQAEHTIGLTLGWGRAGVQLPAGTNAAPLRGAAAVTMKKTGAKIDLALTQHHYRLEGRDEDILQHRTLAEHRARKPKVEKRPLPLYDVKPPAKRQWGMAIDLSVCIGCTACVIACQAENNVPVVGKDGVMMGRAMHWLRIDTYFTEDRDALVQPMLCQHCEKAPCEYVCPVNATVHSEDGLNQMVYNRCVGTRFCSNNCPYKVRRFNWFDFHHDEDATEQLVHNPDVTVRERGVMEKCTFCVQRIRESEIQGKPAPRTACQQACASGAISFGDINDPTSEVARMHGSERAFSALDDLGTAPRVRYLARIKNPNPELA